MKLQCILSRICLGDTVFLTGRISIIPEKSASMERPLSDVLLKWVPF